MICLLARRRLSAYLDGALDSRTSREMTRHLGGCSRCKQEADHLRRMAALLRQALSIASEPDWTGFWPGIVRGIQDGRARGPLAKPRRQTRRWVLSGAAAAAAVVALSFAVAYERLVPSGPEESAVVTAADTQYPGGTMVYHAPEKVAVVWVFDE